MTKLQQLQQEMFNLKTEARNIMNREGVTEAEINEVTNKITQLQAKINLEMQIGEGEATAPQARSGQQLPRSGLDGEDIEPNARYEEAFYNALRGRATVEDREILEARNFSSSVPADGGLLIPNDQQTTINELKREFVALRDYVTVEPVNTLTGNRVLEQDAEHTGFEEFAEGTAIGETATPKFLPITYTIKNYGGILPIPRTLLQDQTANLRNYLNKWLAKKSVATENSLIIATLNKFPKTPIATTDEIKDTLDVTLDPAISAISKIFTNQDGFNFLDKLKDSQGNYLLEKDPKNSTKKMIKGREIVVLSNKTLKTTGSSEKKAPLIMGSLKEGVVLFDRGTTELAATEVGGDAFKNNRVDMRAILRLDVNKFDSAAVVFGEIPITGAAAVSFKESFENK